MKKFCIKFIILFILIDGFIAIYKYVITPNLSGNMGTLGQITFGKKYPVEKSASPIIFDIEKRPAEIKYPIVTIGDSFSQYGKFGYSHYAGKKLAYSISNIKHEGILPEQAFVKMVKHNEIPQQSIVIIESVERSIVSRLNNLDFNDTSMVVFTKYMWGKKSRSYLDDAISFIQKRLGIKQPIHKYSTNVNLFSHDTRKNELYIYDSPWDGDGEFRFINTPLDDIKNAYVNLSKLHHFAEEHQIRMIYLVAADKYDVYEPFILEEHIPNPTLDSIPDEEWIVNSKTILQNAAYAGTKDIYYINDTHWSPVGSKIVGEEVAARIEKLYLNH